MSASVNLAVDLEQQASSIEAIVERVSHLLPEQAPLHAFVHHNTLHAFEHLNFQEAVEQASSVFGTEPYESESAFKEHIASGRILPVDIEAVLDQEVIDDPRPLFKGGVTPRSFAEHRLTNLFEIPAFRVVPYLLAETDLVRAWHPITSFERREALASEAEQVFVGAGSKSTGLLLGRLWESLAGVSGALKAPATRVVRRRDQILALLDIDTDAGVHPLLVRLAGAFLDQGVAYWQLPNRNLGFLGMFRDLYGLPMAPPDLLLRGLPQQLRRQTEENWSAVQTIGWALDALKVSSEDTDSFLQATLLSLRGWAGMMNHLEQRPDRAPTAPPPASLVDYLAVQLTLDVVAAQNALIGEGLDFKELDRRFHQTRSSEHVPLERVYEAFVLAQLMPLRISSLNEAARAQKWMAHVASFGHVERRRRLHLAFERRHRVEQLDGLAAHCGLGVLPAPEPKVQAVFCIDDREESLRRHLEEVYPEMETFGYAGFFGVAMNFQGVDDIRPRPLCPVSIEPQHLIVEQVAHSVDLRVRRKRMRWQGSLTRAFSVSSRSLSRGGLVSVMLGWAATVPLVLRSLFPHLAERLVHGLEHRLAPPPKTRLALQAQTPVNGSVAVGYSVSEMTKIVANGLQTMGLTTNFAPLVVIVGHGSSSLNNPHEAAHDCGATGGGRGGPNAWAFALMANNPEVRRRLIAMGITLPSDIWFVGGYHNTCDDSMKYYELDALPESHSEGWVATRDAFEEACRRDAHERCRRFERSASNLPLGRALSHVRTHANDLAEPRPEYGHATNAVCIVGRRERTRGLFLDRRAFLVSYDPTRDPDGQVLTALLLSVGPVGAGINLEYYFSFVDPVGYGSGTKLPHNITGLIGVMDGHASDLRTGLPWQMVEIHEPVRLLTIVEAPTSLLLSMFAAQPALKALVSNGWIQFVAWDPDSNGLHVFEQGEFRPYVAEHADIPIVGCSQEHYRGQRGHLVPARITCREACS